MKISDYPKFESALSQGRPIIFLCGAGLSVSLGDHAKGGLVGLRKAKLIFLMSKRRNWIEDSVLIVHPN